MKLIWSGGLSDAMIIFVTDDLVRVGSEEVTTVHGTIQRREVFRRPLPNAIAQPGFLFINRVKRCNDRN